MHKSDDGGGAAAMEAFKRRAETSASRAWSFGAVLVWPQVVIVDELRDCKTMGNAGEKMECLQNSISTHQEQAQEM